MSEQVDCITVFSSADALALLCFDLSQNGSRDMCSDAMMGVTSFRRLAELRWS